MIGKRLILFALLFLVLSITFTSSAYGLFGVHDTCTRCAGTGRDPGTIFLTPCPSCGGDGEVGILMDDEDTEDLLSFLFVGGIVILVIVGVVVTRPKKTAMKEIPPTETIYCSYCGTENVKDAVFCKKCGKKIGQID